MSAMPLLDHIVILVPPAVLTAPPPWLTDAFTVVPGGQHAGGTTANQLVLLADGVYLELIAFVGSDDAGRHEHRWGRKSEGRIIDWAVSLVDNDRFGRVQAKVKAAGVDFVYSNLQPGGRTRPDGQVLQWATSAPVDTTTAGSDADLVGLLPFWCLDTTPRRLRVPYEDNDAAEGHPSQAVGVARVTVRVGDAALRARLRGVYDAVLAKVDGGTEDEWTIAVPTPASRGRVARVCLAGPEEAGAAAAAAGNSLELALFTNGPPQTVGGYLVDGWRLSIELVAA